MKTILFQGDSITDASRDRDVNAITYGLGYPTLVSATLGFENGSEYEFYKTEKLFFIYEDIAQIIILFSFNKTKSNSRQQFFCFFSRRIHSYLL